MTTASAMTAPVTSFTVPLSEVVVWLDPTVQANKSSTARRLNMRIPLNSCMNRLTRRAAAGTGRLNQDRDWISKPGEIYMIVAACLFRHYLSAY